MLKPKSIFLLASVVSLFILGGQQTHIFSDHLAYAQESIEIDSICPDGYDNVPVNSPYPIATLCNGNPWFMGGPYSHPLGPWYLCSIEWATLIINSAGSATFQAYETSDHAGNALGLKGFTVTGGSHGNIGLGDVWGPTASSGLPEEDYPSSIVNMIPNTVLYIGFDPHLFSDSLSQHFTWNEAHC